MTNHNRDLGTEDDMNALIDRVRGWSTANSTPSENKALAKALAVIAHDVVRMHDEVKKLKADLKEKVQTADVAVELADLLGTLRPLPDITIREAAPLPASPFTPPVAPTAKRRGLFRYLRR